MNWGGKWIPPFTAKNVFSRRKHQDTLDALNPLNNIQCQGGHVLYSDKNVMIIPNANQADFPTNQVFHPFRIYNVPHPSDSTLDNYTFQVRGGYVGLRPRYINTTAFANEPYATVNNYEYRHELSAAGADGSAVLLTDQSSDYYTTLTSGDFVTFETVNVGNSGDFGVANLAHGARFVLNQTNDIADAAGPAASFWIDIVDETPGALPIVQIKCRMIGPMAGSLRSQTWFPSPNPRQVPIGLVLPKADTLGVTAPTNPSSLVVRQFVYDHVINRMPRGAAVSSGSSGWFDVAGAPTFWRGVWDNAEHGNQYFYPGEMISKAVAGVTSLYVWIGPVGIPTAPPSSGWWLAAGS